MSSFTSCNVVIWKWDAIWEVLNVLRWPWGSPLLPHKEKSPWIKVQRCKTHKAFLDFSCPTQIPENTAERLTPAEILYRAEVLPKFCPNLDPKKKTMKKMVVYFKPLNFGCVCNIYSPVSASLLHSVIGCEQLTWGIAFVKYHGGLRVQQLWISVTHWQSNETEVSVLCTNKNSKYVSLP